MTAAKRKSRPDAGTSGAADRGYEGEQGRYSSAEKKARSKKSDPFTIFKWAWLDQVAADASLPPAASRIAILIAGRYLNRKTGEAWPGVEKLAGELSIKSPNTVRTALRALEAGGHMDVGWSEGGKNQTNHFWPLVGGIPFKNLKGMEGSNPSNIECDTLQNRDAKPLKNLKGNPMKEPSDKPRRALGARAYGDDHQYIDSLPEGSDAHKSASGLPVCKFKIGDEVHIPSGEKTRIAEIGFEGSERFIKLKELSDFSMDALIVPLDADGNPDFFRSWWNDGNEVKTERIDWRRPIDNPAPKSRRKRDAAA